MTAFEKFLLVFIAVLTLFNYALIIAIITMLQELTRRSNKKLD